MTGNKSYFNQIYDRKLITAPMRGFKMRVFMRLYILSISGFAKTNSSGDLTDVSHDCAGIPEIERRAKYVVKRLALLNFCTDTDELCFLDHYTRFDTNLLRDIDMGHIEFKFARSMLNAALMDICQELKERGQK